MTDVGSARVEVTGDVRNFARQTERDLNQALSKINLNPVKVGTDTNEARRSGESAGREMGKGVAKGTDDSRGRISNALKKAFTPDPGMFAALRAPFAAALSTPVTAAVLAVAGAAALAFVGAFAATLATAGLGAVFLGIGAAALFGAKKSRDEAEKDLAKAEEKVRKAEQRAQSGTAASKRSLADARAELAKAQVAMSNNQAFTKLDSSLNRLGDTLKKVAQSAAAPLIEPFARAMDSLGKAAERIEPLISNIFKELAPAIEPLAEGMAGFVEEFLKVLNEDPKTLEGMKDALIALGDNLPRIGRALGEFFAILAENENNVRNMGLLFGLIEISIGQLAVSLKTLGLVLDGLVFAWNAVGDAIGSAIDWITGTAVPSISKAGSAVGDFFKSIPGVISSAWSAVIAFFSGIISSVAGFISSVSSSVIGFFTSLPGRVMGALSALPGLIGSFFSNMISNVAYIIGFGIGTVVSFFINLPGRVLGAIRAIPGLVAGVFNAAWNLARSIVSSGVSAVVSFFSQLPGRARSAISSIVSVVSSVLSSARSAAVSLAFSLVTGAVNVIRNLPGRIRGVLSGVRSAVTGVFAGAGGWLVSAGSNIISGVKNGIVNAIGGAVGAAREAAARIVQGFKDALKIGSPSKLMNLEVGRMIPAGAAEGVKDNMGVLDKQIKDMLRIPSLTDVPTFTVRGGQSRGGDGAALGGAVQVTIQAGAIVVQGQGREAGEEAAEAILERLGRATLAR